MTIYNVEYLRPGETKREFHRQTASSDTEARMRFINLTWVAFTGITVLSIGIASDQPEADKEAGRANAAKQPAVRRRSKPAKAGAPPKSKTGLDAAINGLGAERAKPTLSDLDKRIADARRLRDLAVGRGAAVNAEKANAHLNELKRERHALAQEQDNG